MKTETSSRNERFVLCRKDLAGIGEPKNYCAKPISIPNSLNFCPEHLARLPYWPEN